MGTGDPDIDVPAVQAAVDQGGDLILKGDFSFDRPPTIPTALVGLATVLVSKPVAISGVPDEDGEMTSIEAGTIPFYVEAPGAAATIRRLSFVRPKRNAIFVYAVSGLVVASCKIEGAEPVNHGVTGIAINTVGAPPSPTNPGKPENVSGTLLIAKCTASFQQQRVDWRFRTSPSSSPVGYQCFLRGSKEKARECFQKVIDTKLADSD